MMKNCCINAKHSTHIARIKALEPSKNLKTAAMLRFLDEPPKLTP
jgi:hypothetical protein